MTVDSFIETYRAVAINGHLYFPKIKNKDRAGVTEFALGHSHEIMEKLRMTASRRKTLDALRGDIAKIKSARQDLERRRFSSIGKRLDSLDDIPLSQKRAEQELSAMEEKYPRAAAYLKAKRISESPNRQRAAAGARAVMKLLDGVDVDAVMSNMESEWRECIHDNYSPSQMGIDAPYSTALRTVGGSKTTILM